MQFFLSCFYFPLIDTALHIVLEQVASIVSSCGIPSVPSEKVECTSKEAATQAIVLTHLSAFAATTLYTYCATAPQTLHCETPTLPNYCCRRPAILPVSMISFAIPRKRKDAGNSRTASLDKPKVRILNNHTFDRHSLGAKVLSIFRGNKGMSQRQR